jgi:site-specific DNA recombinase
VRAVIYARVSSAAQRDAHTIESQLQALHAYVAAQGWHLIDTYVDDGRSAKTGMLEKRDAWARLTRDAEAHRFELLVVVDVNRLTRTGSIEERAQILGPFQRLGIQIATPSGGILDLRSFLGEFWVTIQALVAAEENRKRTEAIVRGKRRAITEGRKPAGPTPYGLKYERASGSWSVDPVTGPIVVEMFERVAAGESCIAIADDFHQRGIKRPRGRWARHRVWGIVRSRHPRGEWKVDRGATTIAVPEIVSEQLWQAAQQALLRHKKRGLRRTKHVYLLEGLARCGECGAPILIRSECGNVGKLTGRKSPAAYVCRRRKLSRELGTHCTAPIIPTADADARVWAKLCELVSDPKLMEAALRTQRELGDDPRDWKADADGYRRRIADYDRAETALVDRFARGAVSQKALDPALERINHLRSALEEQLLEAERAAHVATHHRELVEDARTMLRRLAPVLPIASPAARRELVAKLLRPGSVTFQGREIHFIAVPPTARAAARSLAGLAVVRPDGSLWEQHHESEPSQRLEIRLVA